MFQISKFNEFDIFARHNFNDNSIFKEKNVKTLKYIM